MSSSVLVSDCNSSSSERNRVLIFGAAGAIGKKLTKALTEKDGPGNHSPTICTPGCMFDSNRSWLIFVRDFSII